MARIKREEKKGEEVAEPVTSGVGTAKDAAGGQLPTLTASHVVLKRPIGPHTRVAQPVAGPKLERVEPPKVTKYRVIKGGTIAGNGLPQNLTTNKVIDDVNYDIASLESQGIVLERILPPAQEKSQPSA